MKNYELLSFKTPTSLAEAAAEAWIQNIRNGAGSERSSCVALSGGRIAREFFKATVDLARKTTVSLAALHFFWGDERCVPASDPESNFRLAEEWLLRPL